MADPFFGFDTYAHPGDALLAVWRERSPYRFLGYYLPSPCHRDASWTGSRARLVALGYAPVPIYVGYQAQGPCSRRAPTAPQGAIHGARAAALAAAEGFPPRSVVFLDVEHMDAVPRAMLRYLRAWSDALLAGGCAPGIYCHVRNAAAIRGALGAPEPVFWVAGNTPAFSPGALPADSGVPFARLWQAKLDVTEEYGGRGLRIDVDVADCPDPSAPQSAP
jgi:hypothetical protein